MNRQSGFTVLELFFALILVVGIWGWVWNIIKIAGSTFDPITGVLVLRCIGVFVPPLGTVMGFL